MDNVFYITYNPQLKNFLKERNVRYGVCGMNPTNNKMFWVYDRTQPDFNNALDKWIENRKT